MSKKEMRLKASFYMVNDIVKTMLDTPELIESLRERFKEAIALGMIEISVGLFGPDVDLMKVLDEGKEIVDKKRTIKKDKDSNRALA